MYYPTKILLDTLKERYPDKDFIFCMGDDLIESLRKWDNGDWLAENQEFIILRRMKIRPDLSLYPKHYRNVDTIIEASSTKVRNRIREHLVSGHKINFAVNGLTSYSVIKYILENKLYQM